MKIVTLVCITLAVTFAYTDLDDTIDFDAMVNDPEALRKNMDCLLDRGECLPKILKYKNHVLEALTDGCRECNTIETHTLHVFLDGLKKNYPDGYVAFKQKYDPSNTHFEYLLNRLKKF